MHRVILLCILISGIGIGAWAADVAVEGDPYVPAAPGWTTRDNATLELAWDNGTRRWSIMWYTGAGSWVGNDFNTATLKTEHVKILKYRTYSRDNWPNTIWDGFRIAFYNFGGGVPGSMLWPTSGGGYFFKPTGLTGHVWVEIPLDWTVPTLTFVAAQDQFYNHPNCDPFSVDTNETFRGHSWEYYEGSWGALSTSGDPYRNAMIRVQVEDGQSFPGILPASIGRVKALYY